MFLTNAFFEAIGQFWVDEASKIIGTLVILLVAIFLIFLVRAIIKKFIKRQEGKRKHAITLAKMLLSVFRYFVVIVAIIIILGIWGINVLPVLVGAGIVTIAISFGAHKLVADLIGGICIVFEDYYDVGDVVSINGFKGKVIEIGLKSTKLISWKNEVRMIANGDISEVTNYSQYPSVGVVEIQVAYKEDINKVIKILEDGLQNLKSTYEQILEGPNITSGVLGLNENGVSIRITVKTESEKHYEVERAIRKIVKELFEKEHIEIPFNQLVIYNEDSK